MTNVPVTDADREAARDAMHEGLNAIVALIARARAEGDASEREACAKVCDNAAVIHFAERMGRCPESDTAQKIAAAIRARGEGGAK